MRFIVCLATLATLVGSAAVAVPVSYTGGQYFQDFDGLPVATTALPIKAATITGRGPHDFPAAGTMATSGMGGWTLANPVPATSGNTEYKAHHGHVGSSEGRGVVSLGSNNSPERALGAISTSNQINAFGVSLTNDTDRILSRVYLDFVGEQWRRGDDSSPANQLFYDYLITTNPVVDNILAGAFTSIGSYTAPTVTGPTEVALDGNNPLNQVLVSEELTGLNWLPGSTLVLRWKAQDLSGQDDGLAIDNFSLAAVPEPATLSLVGLAFCGLVSVARRRRF